MKRWNRLLLRLTPERPLTVRAIEWLSANGVVDDDEGFQLFDAFLDGVKTFGAAGVKSLA